MSQVSLYNQEGKEVGKVALKGDLWEGQVHSHALYLALRQQLANKRAGTHSTKVRSEVAGSGKKPWKQKGTGRARSGSIRSPLWRHGGVIFGPHPRSHAFELPKQVRRLALSSALRNLLKEERLFVLDKLELKEAKTKQAVQLLKNLKIKSALILVKEFDSVLKQATRNLSGVKLLSISKLNTHDLLRFKKVIVTQEALSVLSEALTWS